MADPELTKAFSEHHAKMIETNTNVKLIEQQIHDLRLSIKSSHLTDREITSLPAGTRLFQSIGKSFVLSDISEIKEHMKKNEDNANNKIKLLQKERESWEAKLQVSEEGIRELVNRKMTK